MKWKKDPMRFKVSVLCLVTLVYLRSSYVIAIFPSCTFPQLPKHALSFELFRWTCKHLLTELPPNPGWFQPNTE